MDNTKICSKCKELKTLEFFYKKSAKRQTSLSKHRPACKTCVSKDNSIRRTGQQFSIKQKAYNAKPERKAKKKKYEASLENAYRRRTRRKEKYQINIQYKISKVLRSRLNKAIKNNYKSGSAIKDLGCSVEDFKAHIEAQFKDNMTWNNWAIEGWHIDHIKPLSAFNLEDPEELKKACHYTNLQPLWAKDNLKKGSNFDFKKPIR